MKNKVLLDTGVLVTFINKRENLYSWTNQQWKLIEPPLLTCEAVITEACFLLLFNGGSAIGLSILLY